jgi:hypothetical protein
MQQDSRNYYDDQFNDRINQIAQPGATPPSTGGSGSSGGGGGGWGLKGGLGGGAVIVFIVIRLVIAAARVGSSSSTPTYYTPPTYQPPPAAFPQRDFDFDRGDRKDGNRVDLGNDAEVRELLRQLREQPDRERGQLPPDAPPDKAPPGGDKE